MIWRGPCRLPLSPSGPTTEASFYHHLLRYFADRAEPVHFSRSRAYKKNDNAHVEQKSWTHVRQLFGYDRINKANLVPAMNEIYLIWSLYQNHFSPVRKLV
ncbi:MAG: hypothetical protein OEZ32_04340 [Nitrospinota bacterium]|nr:hypothetical protein [Nitrospinota bacterium]